MGSFLDDELDTGDIYYYRIRAYSKLPSEHYYTISAVKAAAPLARPSLSVTIYSESGLRLSWTPVSGADGYQVYRSPTNLPGSWASFKSTTATTFNNTSLTPGSTYYYKVIAYKIVTDTAVHRAYGLWSTVKAGAPMVAPVLTASSLSATAIRLSWTPVGGASGYRIYRSLAGRGPWTSIGSTAANWYTDSPRTTGTVYFYRIIPYKNVVDTSAHAFYGLYSDVKAGVPLAAPASIKAVPARSSIRLSWGPVTGASGYQIQYKTRSTVLYLSLKTTQLSATLNSLAANTEYDILIRAYKLVDSVYYYGPPATKLIVKTLP